MAVERVYTGCVLAIIVWVAPQAAFSQTKPDAAEIYRSGRNLENQGNMEAANAKYSEAVTICLDEISAGSGTMDSYAVLTWALQRQKKYNDVIRRGNEALNIRLDYRVMETMGEAYFYLGNFEASLRCMQRYITNISNGDRTSVAYFFVGEIYRLQKKYHYADIAYTAAVRLSPDMALWWYRLGSVRESAGEYQFASEAYAQAVKIDPTYTQAASGFERTRREST
ncbi:MAG: tetratricopeptide repeat protein [Spirochaetaceae bacterium]|jgi:tetratricopeptide (TPR) repeat protein|nr:tetratricopeptide repeat protein [Spirochaetaceae bacterium]